MARIGAAVVVASLAVAACTSDTGVERAVPVPPDASVALAVDDEAGTWSILEQADGCLRLQITADGGRWLSEEHCGDAAVGASLVIQDPAVRFNDRDREYDQCSDDCGGLPPDTEMTAPVVWGKVSPETGFVCVDTEGTPTLARPDAAGFVLAPMAGLDIVNRDPDDILTFLPDGRYVGTDPPMRPELVERCQALGAPDASPPASTAWPFRIDVAAGQRDSELGLLVATDTGFAPEGASIRLLAEGYQIPLRLHPDTTELIVSHEVERAGFVSEALTLPAAITDILTGAVPCAEPPTLVLQVDDDLQADLGVDRSATSC